MILVSHTVVEYKYPTLFLSQISIKYFICYNTQKVTGPLPMSASLSAWEDRLRQEYVLSVFPDRKHSIRINAPNLGIDK
jgi:hypothetical protein